MDTNEKEPIWKVGLRAYNLALENRGANFDAFAQAVIAEHERRKAEQVKAEWKLPDPPEGTEWHRTDWTAEMLPDGYRPLLLAEQPVIGDEMRLLSNVWIPQSDFALKVPAGRSQAPQRTTRPLPVKPDPFAIPDGYVELSSSEKDGSWVDGGKWLRSDGWVDANGRQGGCYASDLHRVIRPIPDPFAAEKAAFAAGKAIEFRDPLDPKHKWEDCDGRPTWIQGFLYRVKPEPFQVELGPDDVPPGSVLRWIRRNKDGFSWFCVAGMTALGDAELTSGATLSMRELMDAEINRSIPDTGKWDATAWQPCSKIKTE